MVDDLEIRESVAGDLAAIEAFYPAAFPDEDLLPLVRELLQASPIILSLVAVMGPSLVGHVVFTRCGVADSEDEVGMLGPLGVTPARQRQGIGSALVRAGLDRLKSDGMNHVYVLGDPNYYGRLGFLPEKAVSTPYPLPAEWEGAWQSLSLRSPEPRPHGKLTVPQPWRKPALWSD